MIRILQPLVIFALAVCPLLDAHAQQPATPVPPAETSAPSIVIMQPGVERLLEDIQYLTGLAGEEGVEVWPEIRELIADVFLLGADPKLPLRVDVLLSSDETRYIFSAPVDPSQKFDESHPAWVNIVAFGLQPRALGSGLYQTRSAFEGFMRYSNNYISIASKKADIPANLPPRREALQTLLERGYDLGAEIKNPVGGQETRRDGMKTVRENLMAALAKQPDETETAFETRKLVLSQQIDELERFFVEAQHVIAGWTTDVQQKQGRLNIELTPIQGTPLAASLEMLGQKPSRFAGIPQSDGSILSGRINHPLDEMRQKNYLAMFAQLRTLAEQEIETDAKLSAEQKAASKKLSAAWFDSLSAGAQSGVLDGFVESWQAADGKRTFVLGGVVPDSQAIVTMLELLPQARPGSAVELNVEQHAEHAVHRLTVSEDAGTVLKDLFGEVPEVFVATGQGTVFVAAGAGANAALKTAIDQSQAQGTPQKQSVFVKLFAKVGPWIEFLDKQRGTEGDAELRRDAIQHFQQGNDLLNFEMERVDNTAVVRFSVEEGILGFVGSVITDVYKENLR